MRVRLPRLPLLCLALPLLLAAQPKPDTPHALERMVVTGKRPAAADAENLDVIRTYDESEVETSGAFTLQEFIEALPRGNGDEQVILIDGMPADLDLASLSPRMAAAIEVSYTGAMPAYGAYTRGGRVINIRLKEDYDGREISLRTSGSLHADAWRHEVSGDGKAFHGPWQALYSIQYSRNDAVTADARDFSREQDHRARGGRDFRLPWGDPAVVQAVAGSLNGVHDAAGNPVSVALVPEDAAGALAAGDFLPGSGPVASGQRFFNTSPYLYLAGASESRGGNFRLTRTVGKLRLGLSTNYRAGSNRREGPPPVSAASTETLVPAALNPFGQDVLVGLVHTGFGPVVQRSENDRAQLSLSASWMGQDWRGLVMLIHTRTHTDRDTRDLDPAAFSAALAAPDPAGRFNPFVGAGSAANAAVYQALAVHRTEESANNGTRLNWMVHGPVARGRAAGPVRVAVSGDANWRENERIFRNLRGVADGSTHHHDASYGLNGNADLPLIKERPRIYRLDARMSASYSLSDDGGDNRRHGEGVFWSPARPWVFRANFGQNFSSPGEENDEDSQSRFETLMDPRRTPSAAENVQVLSRRSRSTQSSRGDELQLSALFQPAARPGLQLNLNYSQTRRNRATGSPFRPQDVIDNEALFAGRVVREAPTAADLALGQPGRILTVDTTAAAVANEEQRRIDFSIEYQPPSGGPNSSAAPRRDSPLPRNNNRFTFNLDLEYPLDSRYEVAEGQGFVSREEGPANLPDWSAQARVRWQRRHWHVAAHLRHDATSRLGTIPALTTVSVNAGYRFAEPVWGKFGKGMLLGARVQNLGGDRPPYADTILGYRGGSAVGTVLSLSVQVPL